MFGIFLPKWIYEALPYVYIMLGVLGFTFPETYGRISGIVLVFCSLLILKMRKEYRK